MNKHISIVAACLVVLCGCGDSSSELSKDKDKEMRANFKRALTDEELKQMQGGAPSQPRDTTKAPEGASGPPANAPE